MPVAKKHTFVLFARMQSDTDLGMGQMLAATLAIRSVQTVWWSPSKLTSSCLFLFKTSCSTNSFVREKCGNSAA